MSDLIDRQEAINVVQKWFDLIKLNGDICIDGLISLPSVPTEIIKCKDCVYFRADTEHPYWGICCNCEWGNVYDKGCDVASYGWCYHAKKRGDK